MQRSTCPSVGFPGASEQIIGSFHVQAGENRRHDAEHSFAAFVHRGTISYSLCLRQWVYYPCRVVGTCAMGRHKRPASIRLTESVLFLKNADHARRSNRPDRTVPTSMLRGLLILDISKPTRISSIELHLTGKVMTSWPEGAHILQILLMFHVLTHFRN